MSIACVVIASEKRRALVWERVVPSVIMQSFDEIVVVGDWDEPSPSVRYLRVEPLTHSTIDALVKRDVGTLATSADWLCYLSDDHALHAIPRRFPPNMPLIGVPLRFCWHDKDPKSDTVNAVVLNAGLKGPNAPYCGGHAGIFARSLVQRRPWSTMPRTCSNRGPIWDLLASRLYVSNGAALVAMNDFVIEDLEPQGLPWL